MNEIPHKLSVHQEWVRAQMRKGWELVSFGEKSWILYRLVRGDVVVDIKASTVRTLLAWRVIEPDGERRWKLRV